jgi:hypothetical protein
MNRPPAMIGKEGDSAKIDTPQAIAKTTLS